MRTFTRFGQKGLLGFLFLQQTNVIKRTIAILIVCCMVLGMMGCQEYQNAESSTPSIESSHVSAESSTIPTETNTTSTESSTIPTVSGTSPTESSAISTETSTTLIENSTIPTESSTIPTESSTSPTESEPNFDSMNKLNYFESLTFHDESANIHYLFHSPMRQSEEQSPLIIFLHGLGDTVYLESLGTADPLITTLVELEKNSGEYSTYTLVPKTPGPYDGWWTAEQLTAFKKLILQVIETENIDPKRVYITGISMGGFTTCQIVNEMPPNTFAAAVPLSGAYNMTDPAAVKDTAFYIYHAEHDSVVNVDCSRQLYNQLLQSGHPNVTYMEYSTGDHIDPLYWAYAGVDNPFYPWLFAQRLP